MIDETKINEVEIDEIGIGIPPEEDEQVLAYEREEEILNLKKLKKKSIEKISVNVNKVPYAGDDISQNRMGNTVAIANWVFNKSIAPTLANVANAEDTDDVTKAMLLGLSSIFDGIYAQVYKNNKVDWKGSDGKLHHVNVESVAEALYKAMLEVGKVIEKTTKELEK
jgi:hypothetical protein